MAYRFHSWRIVWAAGTCVVAAGSIAGGQTIVNQPGVTVSTHASGLSQLTGFAFMPSVGGIDLLAIEKASGQVRRVTNGVVGATVLNLPVNSASERGLLGIAVDPNFSANRQVYLYYSLSSTGADSEANSEWSLNRLSRFTLNAAGTQLTGELPLATFGTNADGQAQGPNHDGGPLRFGADGKLYGITGDLNRDRAEQNQQGQAANTAFAGGIYRLNTDGTVPADNPLVGLAGAAFHRWYAYGIRNSFGMAFDPVTSALWETENGPGSYDEINQVAPAFNSGWSDIMGPDSRDAQGVGDLVNLAVGSTYSDPEFSWFNPIAVTAIDFLSDSALAGYGNAVLVGDANNGQLYVLRLNAARNGFVLSGGLTDLVADDTTERNSLLFGQNFGPVIDIQVGPDGAVYVGSLNGSIYRMVPEPSVAGIFAVLAVAGLRRRKRQGS